LASGATPNSAISEKRTPFCYPRQLKRRGEAIISEFASYSNTLMFSTGNEVNHYVPAGNDQWWNAPCLKKFGRDMRAFIKGCPHMRKVPVGLIAADTDRDENAAYYNCESDRVDELEYAEWFGLNTYVYCDGNATTPDEAEGFKSLETSFQSYNYSIPVLLTEYGCLSKSFPTIDGYQGQRNFNQARWFGLPKLQNLFAGGFAFEYSIESDNAHTPFPFKEFGEQNYGIGYLSPEDCDDVTIMCKYEKTPSFYNLAQAYANITADNSTTLDTFVPPKNRTKRSKCPAHFPDIHSFRWQADWEPSRRCPSIGTKPCQNEGDFCAVKSNPDSMGIMAKLYIATFTVGAICVFILLRMKNSTEESSSNITVRSPQQVHRKQDSDSDSTFSSCSESSQLVKDTYTVSKYASVGDDIHV